jgi:acyl-CoA thioester hydrolase
MKIRIYYEDTDSGGIVYHSNYIKYCERARSEEFFKKGLSPQNGDEFFVVKSLEADFISTAKLGEMIEVKNTLEILKKASAVVLQEIFKDDKKIYSQKVRLAFVKAGKPSAIPQYMIDVLKGY